MGAEGTPGLRHPGHGCFLFPGGKTNFTRESCAWDPVSARFFKIRSDYSFSLFRIQEKTPIPEKSRIKKYKN
jgi:hypothetical protein